MQEALIRALRTWPFGGVPTHPAAWLHTAALRYATDELRRNAKQRGVKPLPKVKPTSIVRLNRAVALSQAGQRHQAQQLLAAVVAAGDLSDYPPLAATLRAGL